MKKADLSNPSELEKKILDCFGNITPISISIVLGIKKAKVYSTFAKFGLRVRGKDTKLNVKKEVKKRVEDKKRYCKPYKTSQLG